MAPVPGRIRAVVNYAESEESDFVDSPSPQKVKAGKRAAGSGAEAAKGKPPPKATGQAGKGKVSAAGVAKKAGGKDGNKAKPKGKKGANGRGHAAKMPVSAAPAEEDDLEMTGEIEALFAKATEDLRDPKEEEAAQEAAEEPLAGACSSQLLKPLGAIDETVSLDAGPIWRGFNGADIVRKGGMRRRSYLLFFPGMLRLKGGGRIGHIDKLDTLSPEVYLDFPDEAIARQREAHSQLEKAQRAAARKMKRAQSTPDSSAAAPSPEGKGAPPTPELAVSAPPASEPATPVPKVDEADGAAVPDEGEVGAGGARLKCVCDLVNVRNRFLALTGNAKEKTIGTRDAFDQVLVVRSIQWVDGDGVAVVQHAEDDPPAAEPASPAPIVSTPGKGAEGEEIPSQADDTASVDNNNSQESDFGAPEESSQLLMSQWDTGIASPASASASPTPRRDPPVTFGLAVPNRFLSGGGTAAHPAWGRREEAAEDGAEEGGIAGHEAAKGEKRTPTKAGEEQADGEEVKDAPQHPSRPRRGARLNYAEDDEEEEDEGDSSGAEVVDTDHDGGADTSQEDAENGPTAGDDDGADGADAEDSQAPATTWDARAVLRNQVVGKKGSGADIWSRQRQRDVEREDLPAKRAKLEAPEEAA